MPESHWMYGLGDDNRVEIVVEPDFHGDLVRMAKFHTVWIVNSESNRAQIDYTWSRGNDESLYEVSRIPVANSEDREGNLLMILESLDDHYAGYDVIVHGLEVSDSMNVRMETEGFRITEALADGFVAVRIPEVRDRLIGRL